MLCYFTDETYTGNATLIEEDSHAYPLLVKAGTDASGDPTNYSLKAPAACTQLSVELSKPRRNYVETERGYIRSTIDRMTRAPHNFIENRMPVTVSVDREIADFTMTKSMSSSIVKAPSGLDKVERSLR